MVGKISSDCREIKSPDSVPDGLRCDCCGGSLIIGGNDDVLEYFCPECEEITIISQDTGCVVGGL